MQRKLDKYERPILTLAELTSRSHLVLKGGAEWRMACPIHEGTNPTSFSLDLTTGMYHCFSCGAGGQLQEYWQHSGKAAVKVEYASPVSATQFLHKAQSPDPQRLTRLAKWLARSQTLLALPTPQRYLAERGIQLSTAQRMGVGYCPDFRFKYVQKQGQYKLSHRQLLAPALLFGLYRPDGLANLYARGISRQRLHLITSGSKGVFNPFAFERASNRQPLILVEGCFDVLALAESGYECAVALCGTALIEPHWYSQFQEVILAFDQDEAGQLRQYRVAKQLCSFDVRCYHWPQHFWQGHKDFASYWQVYSQSSPSDWGRWLDWLRRF